MRFPHAVEQWGSDEGFDWLGSDARIGNDESHSWHQAAGFTEEEERLDIFGKATRLTPVCSRPFYRTDCREYFTRRFESGMS